MPRTARRLERRQFKTWTHRGPWETHWLSLDAGEQTAWNEFAADQLLHKLSGQPSLVSGKEFFVTYWSQATLFNGSEPSSPWEPPAAPEWNPDTQPFEPWLDNEDGMAVVVKSETTEERTFFFVAQPPFKNRGRLCRATCQPLGVFSLPASAAGARWSAPSAAAVALFGPNAEDATCQQWMLAWELSGWFPRPVLDPCYSPPLEGPMPAAITFEGTIDGYGPFSEEYVWNEDDQLYLGRDYFNYANIEVTAGGTFWHVQCYAPGEIYFFDGFKPGTLASPLGLYDLNAFGGLMGAV